MWVDHTLKCPDDGHWYAVVYVDENGNTELLRYLSPVVDAELVAQVVTPDPAAGEDPSADAFAADGSGPWSEGQQWSDPWTE